MPLLMESPPYSPVETVTEILHGKSVSDAYRWLEDQDSPRTRDWIAAQTRYTRSYLDSIPGRARIRERIRELLDVETYDSLQKAGNRYFFRKRVPGQEQPCICFREGLSGPDELLIDPAQRGGGPHTSVKPLQVSPDGLLLFYEMKEGGERSGTFELLNLETRHVLPDALTRGYLRGFAFAPDSRAFYYVHEPLDLARAHHHAVYKHTLGTSSAEDEQIFFAGEDKTLRLHIVRGLKYLGFLVLRDLDKTYTDFYLFDTESANDPEPLFQRAEWRFEPLLLRDGRILAITDFDAPNSRIVEVRPREGLAPEFIDLIPNGSLAIQDCAIGGNRIFVSYLRNLQTEIVIFDLAGTRLGEVPVDESDTVRLLGGSENRDELFLEQESFTKPIQICRYLPSSSEVTLWAERKTPFDSQSLGHARSWFTAKDGTQIPIFLVGQREVLNGGPRPTIMTSYGGYGVSMTPQFSVFVTFLIERGCLFALPNIRGGSEFGVEWHHAAKRRNRQVAFDDFLSAAEWLVETGRTESSQLAIFGGSNSGLLVGAAMTQRPDLFRAIVCMAPLLDMLRYHLFDTAGMWKEEFGTAEEPEDFVALSNYSPYHNIRDGTAYPATMIVSGDSDQKCNPLHARKMIARLQAANISEHPIILNYSRERGHSPAMPLSVRIDALTDRMAFLCEQLQLPA